MTPLTVLYAGLFYAAGAVLLVGLALKIAGYARTPAPLRIPTTPAPRTRGGVALRVLREVTLFESLFRGNKWIWLFGWTFHVALALVLVRHLRYFTQPIWAPVVVEQPFGVYAGFALLAGLAGLWARRLLVERIRYISTWSDHLMLALLAAIALSGLAINYIWRTDVVAVKEFMLGLLYFDWRPLPSDPLLLVHLFLVAALMAVFPASKLLHAPGVFFSPSRNQPDDSRERRHVAPWAAEAEPRE
ncbi:MAG TPA: respiratory nitrate reductase subunit gamma [Burkholderiales bacterium]|nr:respiratory nitrate reductase subunit gamma [Burkholderiales bacterium]